MENKLEFKVVDSNADVLGHLFSNETSTQEPVVTPVTPSVIEQAVVTPVIQPTSTAPVVQPIGKDELISNDDLLAAIGATTLEDEVKPVQPTPVTPPSTESASEESKKTPSGPVVKELPEGLSDDDVKLRNKLYTQHLIDSGVWAEFEGVTIDDIDFSVENFQKIVEIQNNLQSQRQVGDKWDGIKKSNKMVETILDYIENEKDPAEIIKMFKEQEQLTSQLDFSTIDGNLDAIRKFYTEKASPKWDIAKVNRYIKSLELEGDEVIKSEGKYVQDQYGEVFETERKAKVAATEAEAKARDDKRKADIQSNFKLLQAQGLKSEDAQRLLRDVYQPKYTQEGSDKLLTELDVKLMQIKEDPEAYLDYIQYVLDRQGYKKALATKTSNEVTTNVWSQLKTGKKDTGTNVTINTSNGKGNNNIYEQLLKNK